MEVYLDHAATTPLDKNVLKSIQPFFNIEFGNPSALYKKGVAAAKAVENARKNIADILHAQQDTIIFTSGGTESDNLAIFGVTHAHTDRPHIISIGIEHDAVIKPLEHLKDEGYEVTYIPVDKKGSVDPDSVLSAIKPQTVLITIMYANNEIGTIEPIAEIGRGLIRYRKENKTEYPYFHTDACQAAGYLNLNVEQLHVDLLSLNGSKIYGPKGVGVLYIRRGIKFDPQLLGGSQEKARRAGTENVPGIVGLAKALEITEKLKTKETKRLFLLSKYFYDKLIKAIPQAEINGPEIGPERLPNNLNFYIPGIDGETMVLYLDGYGIACSTASACNTEAVDTSHVLRSIGASFEVSTHSLRFTMGRSTTKNNIDHTIKSISSVLKGIYKK